MRVLILTPFIPGHFNAMVAVVEALREAGHEAAWAYPGVQTAAARATITSVGATYLELPWPYSPLSEGQGEEGSDFDRRLQRFRRVMIESDVVSGCMDLIRTWKPNAIAIDPLIYCGLIAALKCDVPFVCVHTNLCIAAPADLICERVALDAALADARAELFDRHGVAPLPFRLLEAVSPHANTLWTTESFLRGAALPANTHPVGPSIPRRRRPDQGPFDWGRLDGRPLVLGSHGTGYAVERRFFEALALACKDLDMQLLIADRGALDARTLVGEPILEHHVPQLEVLPRCTAFVNHGGANSVMESTYFGVPQLITPLASDQPVQAHFVEASGIGESIDVRTASAEPLRQALERLTRPDSEVSRRLTAVSADYRRQHGPEGVVELLARIAL